MKTLPKTIITWFFGLFNIGIYSQSDALDSLVPKLKLVGLSKHADTIAALSKTIEHQQDIMILLDGIKCFVMVFSLGVLIATNQDVIKITCQWLKNLLFRFFSFLGKPFKTFLFFLRKTFKSKKQ